MRSRHIQSCLSWKCRDVFNEKPAADLLQNEDAEADNPEALPRGAIIHTSRGDISVKLFPSDCPRSVENFTTHSRDGYYSGVIFHRVIKGFCIQTGDPLGKAIGMQHAQRAPFVGKISTFASMR